MFKNNFVLAIKDEKGEILRETKDQIVSLPYNSHYSILLKNKNDRLAAVELFLDGEDILSGEKLIIPANETVNLERFASKGVGLEGNKFKFVDVNNEDIEGSKKSKKEIGKVKAKFYLEKELVDAEHDESSIWETIKKELERLDKKPEWVPVIPYYPYPYHPTYPRPWWRPYYEPFYYTTITGFTSDNTTITCSCSSNSTSTPIFSATVPLESIYITNSIKQYGMTVEGEKSTQNIDTDIVGELSSTCTEIVLTIKPSIKALTVSETKKIYCEKCGCVNKNSANFCMNCGKKIYTTPVENLTYVARIFDKKQRNIKKTPRNKK